MRKDRVKLIAVVLVFALPIIFAFILQPLKDAFIAEGTISHGNIVSPQVELSELAKKAPIKGVWTLLAFADQHCDQRCLDNVYKMQQVRLAQGEESKRVARMLISNGKLPVKDLESLTPYNGTQNVRLSESEYKQLSKIISSQIDNDLEGNIYLIDPLGYYMMTFPNSLVPKGVITDLRLLLKNSRVG